MGIINVSVIKHTKETKSNNRKIKRTHKAKIEERKLSNTTKTHKVKLETKTSKKQKKKSRKLTVTETKKDNFTKTKVLYPEDNSNSIESKIERELHSSETTCVLSARIYPLLFLGQIQSMELKMLLSSECLDRPVLLYFLVPPNVKTNMSFLDHPSFVNLVLYGRTIKLKFDTAYQRGKGFNKNLAYQFFQVYPADEKMRINSFDEHNVKITPIDPLAYYTMSEIKNLQIIPNPSPCSIISDNKIMNCVVS